MYSAATSMLGSIGVVAQREAVTEEGSDAGKSRACIVDGIDVD